MNKKIVLALSLAVLATGSFLLLRRSTITPSISVADQALRDGQVTVAAATAVADSWLVIQTETNGVPGPVIGYKKISKGENSNVAIEIDKTQATPRLFAMIHVDDGERGKLDFPGADMPLMYQGEMVSEAFSLN